MALKFFYAPMSTASLTSAVLAELGIPVEKVKLDLKAGDQKKPDFLAINPNGKVPAIVDDGVPVFESLAILIHLGDKYGVDKGLWPAATSPDRARALSWATWTTVTMTGAGYRLMANTGKGTPKEMQNELQAKQARADFDQAMRILEAQLARQPFLIGEKFSLVDSHAALTLGWMRSVLGYDLGKLPHVEKWLKTCEERPASRAAE